MMPEKLTVVDALRRKLIGEEEGMGYCFEKQGIGAPAEKEKGGVNVGTRAECVVR
tara:strand:+ start:1002 stop:1166 length:165 start_codon:yes stop_codon:yes gene_type:complete